MTPKLKKKALVLLFLSPMLVGLLAFFLLPFVSAILLSFQRIRGLRPPTFIGLENFHNLFSDEVFWLSLTNTLRYLLAAVPVGLVFSFFLAIILRNQLKINGVFRTVFYLPSITPTVASVMIFLLVFGPSRGLVNTFLRSIGITGPGWFTDPKWAITTLVITAQWGAGGAALIFLGGLNNIDLSLYEAAEIDGANVFRQFSYVTLPLMTPTIFMNLITSTIGGMQVFTQAYIIEQAGGGKLNSLLFTVLFIFKKAFESGRMGYASAASLVLFVFIFILSALIWMSRKFWVFNE